MIKRFGISLIISTLVFIACYTFGNNNRPLYNFDEPRIQHRLKDLEFTINEYHRIEETLPEEKALNKSIAECYLLEPTDEAFRNEGFAHTVMSVMPSYLSQIKKLDRWNSPPIFIIDKKLPSGFGFYLNGEDDISKTSGNDPDDINSWDKTSWHFYYDRVHRKDTKIIIIYSLIPALICFFFLMKLRKNNRQQQ